ncbi:MAG: CHAT domain-containing protein [Desulfobacteraceae bacterium]|nr:CHAT domain-containing protein [Desulfobacteraceae bacterium]
MKEYKTIYLDAARDEKYLKIGIYKPNDVIWRYEARSVSMDKVKKRCCEMTETLNRIARNACPQQSENLKFLGQMLCNDLLTSNIEEKLTMSGADYLVLKIDEHLVDIPWELICIDQEFLCQRFNMGRVVKTRQQIPECAERSLAKPMNMWILADPRGDLAVAASEGVKIFKDMAQMNRNANIITPFLDSEITSDYVKENIKNYDLLHFAGHADYNSKNRGQSRWRLLDDDFTVDDIDSIAGDTPMPSLIFSNACQSARTVPWEHNENGMRKSDENASFGLANAFLRAGVKHYIGTSWEILDESGSHFAYEFYKLLSSGKTIGEAVKQARSNLTREHGSDICWISYVLYGDPASRYFTHQIPDPKKPKNLKPIIKQNIMTRGSFFDYALNPLKIKNILVVSLSIAILLFGITATYFMIKSVQIENRRADIEIVKEKQGQDFEKIIITQKQIYLKRERIDCLIKQIEKNVNTDLSKEQMPDDLPSDGWTSCPLTIAVYTDESLKSFLNQERDEFIASAIQSELFKYYPRITLVERKSLGVWEELRIATNSSLVKSRNRFKPDLLPARLILHLGVSETPSPVIWIRLQDTKTTNLIYFLSKPLETGSVLAQKKKLCEELLEILDNQYPLRCIISDLTEQDAGLNIGSDEGVMIGQRFKVIDQDIILEVTAVKSNTSIARIVKGESHLIKGAQAEEIRN